MPNKQLFDTRNGGRPSQFLALAGSPPPTFENKTAAARPPSPKSSPLPYRRVGRTNRHSRASDSIYTKHFWC